MMRAGCDYIHSREAGHDDRAEDAGLVHRSRIGVRVDRRNAGYLSTRPEMECRQSRWSSRIATVAVPPLARRFISGRAWPTGPSTPSAFLICAPWYGPSRSGDCCRCSKGCSDDSGRSRTGMIEPLGVLLELLGPEIYGAQVAGGIAFGFVVEMRGVRMATFAAGSDRAGAYLVAELDDRDKTISAGAVVAFRPWPAMRAKGSERAPKC